MGDSSGDISKINSTLNIDKDQKNTKVNDQLIPSVITGIIGKGDEAKNSFVYLVLKWGFISGCIITILVVINHWCFRVDEKVPDFSNDVKLVWDIIVPLLTLALGYAFGRSKE